MKYEGYKPHDAEKFGQMTRFFACANNEAELGKVLLLFVVDMSFHREDLLVVRERRAEELGL